MPEPTEVRRPTLSYIRLLARQGGDDETLRAAILDGVGVSAAELEDPRTEITLTQLIRQIDNMNRLFGEGWLLDAPELWSPAALGALGVAVTTSPTVGAGVEIWARYAQAQWTNQHLMLVRHARALTLRHRRPVTLPKRLHRYMAEFVLLSVSSSLGVILGGARREMRFDIPSPPPGHAARLEQELGGEVRWRASSTAISVPARLLALASPLADAALHRAAVERLEASLRSAGAPEGVKGRVELLLAQSESGRLSSADAARTLGFSQRTLVRRLAHAGIGYHELVDAELRSRAEQYLDAGALTRAEIADRLGFADATGFSRACRRWFTDEGSVRGRTSP
ncbi:MAG: AraC family transcriptional regulator ligand-binding domain-containing protein [Caulobacteraceae bacterium]